MEPSAPGWASCEKRPGPLRGNLCTTEWSRLQNSGPQTVMCLTQTLTSRLMFTADLLLPYPPSLGFFSPVRYSSNRWEEMRVLSLKCPVREFIFYFLQVSLPLNPWKLPSKCKFYTHVQLGLKRWVGIRAPSLSSNLLALRRF